MTKTILITGSTDGIGLETAKMLLTKGHRVLLHGRNASKLEKVARSLAEQGEIESYIADLSDMNAVAALAEAVTEKHDQLDVLINNAGVFVTSNPITKDGLDVRFVVNTIAPYLLTQRLLPLLGESGRVVNVSSAAQAPVNPQALAGKIGLSANDAYAQSKLAITSWTNALANSDTGNTPLFVSVNPGSFLGSKMVKEAYGMRGKDIRIGGDILTRAAVSDEFANASGQYFDNDSGRFASPHPDALNSQKAQVIVQGIEAILATVMA